MKRNGPQPRDTSSMIGRRFGTLLVIGTSAFRQNRHSYVQVKCDCGAERPARVSALTREQLTTCGGPVHVAIARQSVVYTDKEAAALVRSQTYAAVSAVVRRQIPGRTFKTYAVRAIGSSLVKIGKAFDIAERLRDLQVACPLPLLVFASTYRDIEKEMHRRLINHRAHGEWFRYSDEVHEAILSEMQPDDISGMELATFKETVIGGTRKCHHCGELGHYAKTCVRKQAA